MPQATQIAPKWLQPHVMTVIHDNTVFEESTVTVDSNVKFLAVFASSQGPDNVLIKKTDLADFKATYGDSNYAKYGQPLLMPLAELKAGNASVYCMRVMPEDATYANVVISANYKIVEEQVNILEYDEDGSPLLDDYDEPVYRTVIKTVTPEEWDEIITADPTAANDASGISIYEEVFAEDGTSIKEFRVRALDSTGNVVQTGTDANGNPVYEYERVKPTTNKMIIKYTASYMQHGNGAVINEEDGSVEEGKSKWYAGATSRSALADNFSTICALAEDKKNADYTSTGEWQSVPLFYINMAGRGVYGNNFRFRISPDTAYEKDYGIKMYSFEALNATNGISQLATYIGSIVTSPKFSETTFITDVMADRDTGDSYFDITVDESAVEKLYDVYVQVLNDAEKAGVRGLAIPDIDEFDPIFGNVVGSQIKASLIEVLEPSDENPDVYALDSTIGIPLLGGSDGIFGNDVEIPASKIAEDEANANGDRLTEAQKAVINEKSVQDAITAAYIKAFSGEYDVTILAPRRTPLNIMLDANYPMEVKRKMYELAGVREDCMLVLDNGIITTRPQISLAMRNMKDMNERYATKEFQHYQVRDPKTNKRVYVTTTYKWATDFAFHVKTYGNHIPFVKKYATLTNHVKNSLAPSIELTTSDMALKEKLYEARFNYYETIGDNLFARATQNTAQGINSDLLEENNMRTLLELKNSLEEDCWNNLYNFSDPADRASFTQAEMAKFSPWIGSKVLSLDIYFDMNPWEAERSILHCYVAVVFRQLNKRTIIEIDVNKRT